MLTVRSLSLALTTICPTMRRSWSAWTPARRHWRNSKSLWVANQTARRSYRAIPQAKTCRWPTCFHCSLAETRRSFSSDCDRHGLIFEKRAEYNLDNSTLSSEPTEQLSALRSRSPISTPTSLNQKITKHSQPHLPSRTDCCNSIQTEVFTPKNCEFKKYNAANSSNELQTSTHIKMLRSNRSGQDQQSKLTTLLALQFVPTLRENKY